MARYIAPVSTKTYSNAFAIALARVLFPQDEKPSIAMMIFFSIMAPL
jgi:hypothetical protein